MPVRQIIHNGVTFDHLLDEGRHGTDETYRHVLVHGKDGSSIEVQRTISKTANYETHWYVYKVLHGFYGERMNYYRPVGNHEGYSELTYALDRAALLVLDERATKAG